MKNNPKELIDDLKVIRTIHSNKARSFEQLNFWYLMITVIIAVIVTFIGFSGADTFAKIFLDKPENGQIINTSSQSQIVDTVLTNTPLKQVQGQTNTDEFASKVKLIMDLMTLSILVISILGLIVRFESKANKHNLSVIRLTEFISDVEFNYLSSTSTSPSFRNEDILIYAERYKSLLNSLPATTDKDYFHALKTIKKKKKIKAFIESDDYDKLGKLSKKWRMLWI